MASLVEIQKSLIALADQFEQEYTRFGAAAFEEIVWRPANDPKTEVYERYAEAALQLLFEALRLDGFQANSSIRNRIAWARSITLEHAISAFDSLITNCALYATPYKFYCPLTYRYVILATRLVAKRMLLPRDPEKRIRNKARKENYRLPPEQRSRYSPYIEETGAFYAGEFYSLEAAYQRPEEVVRLYIASPSPESLIDLWQFVNLRHLQIAFTRDNPHPLPEFLCEMSNLVSLVAGWITELPECIDALTSLEYVFIVFCGVPNISRRKLQRFLGRVSYYQSSSRKPA
jgi:hypothetical protein